MKCFKTVSFYTRKRLNGKSTGLIGCYIVLFVELQQYHSITLVTLSIQSLYICIYIRDENKYYGQLYQSLASGLFAHIKGARTPVVSVHGRDIA